MEHILLVYFLVFTFLLVAILAAMRGDGFLSRKWAKVRVRTDASRRRLMPERPEDEFEDSSAFGFILLGAILLFVYILLSKG